MIERRHHIRGHVGGRWCARVVCSFSGCISRAAHRATVQWRGGDASTHDPHRRAAATQLQLGTGGKGQCAAVSTLPSGLAACGSGADGADTATCAGARHATSQSGATVRRTPAGFIHALNRYRPRGRGPCRARHRPWEIARRAQTGGGGWQVVACRHAALAMRKYRPELVNAGP